MNKKDREILKSMDLSVASVIQARLEIASIFAATEADLLLDQLVEDHIDYEIIVGYYNDHGFEVDQSLDIVEFSTGEKLVDYLIDFYSDNNATFYMPSNPTVAIKIQDSIGSQEYWIEYDGYNLDFDLGQKEEK
jgi:hypothetical protein